MHILTMLFLLKLYSIEDSQASRTLLEFMNSTHRAAIMFQDNPMNHYLPDNRHAQMITELREAALKTDWRDQMTEVLANHDIMPEVCRADEVLDLGRHAAAHIAKDGADFRDAHAAISATHNRPAPTGRLNLDELFAVADDEKAA